MKTAIGMMACIAIAFLYITSPQSTTTYASVGYQHQDKQSTEIASQILNLEKSLQEAMQQLLSAQVDARSEQATGLVQIEQQLDQKLTRVINEQIESRLVSAKTDQACSDEDLRSTIKQMQQDLAELKSKQSTAVSASPVVKSVSVSSGFGSSGSSLGYSSSSSPTVSYGSTGRSVSYGSSGISYSQSGSRTVSRTTSRPALLHAANLGRWQNNDGLSFRQHAEVMHGINTAGMTDQQVAAMRDHDHDTYGPEHSPELRSSRAVTRTVSQTQNCPGGICPTGGAASGSVQVRSFGSGLLGFGILGRGR